MPLFNRVQQALSGSGGAANEDPHLWKLQSSYDPSKPGGKQTVIPSPKVFSNAFIPAEPEVGNLDSALSYPDVSHAAVHLALLECFWNLRLSASALDVEVDRPPAYEEKPRTLAAEPTTLPESQRWDLLIKLATARFAAWWSNIEDVLKHAAAYTHHASTKVAVQLAKDQLPPLDVLLVWYAFMLDTDAYRAACRERQPPVPGIERLCFPWLAIRDAIDMETMHYTLSRPAEILFSTLSGQSADILTYLEQPPAYADPRALPAGLDLAVEVKNHEEFFEKAHRLLWIRGPALNGSLVRSSVDYLDFHLKRAAPSIACEGDLPFGIELLWRTHRLFPRQYDLFLKEIGDEEQSSDTKELKSHKSLIFLAEASDVDIAAGQCCCWTCERIRDDIPTFVHVSPPDASTASTSSAAPSTSIKSEISTLSSEQLRQIKDDLCFYSAVENARERGAVLPTRPPTAAEKRADKLAKEKQKEVGYRPGLGEYTEILPDGTRKIRRQKNMAPYGRGLWTY
ncbi:hypothetical protein GQ53DRAFT_404319 [Thozetella sp. PMI_491]|nr:hypothetical protein GQ53DRAFT_404319 [Thozetella sp. PMI_491]